MFNGPAETGMAEQTCSEFFSKYSMFNCSAYLANALRGSQKWYYKQRDTCKSPNRNQFQNLKWLTSIRKPQMVNKPQMGQINIRIPQTVQNKFENLKWFKIKLWKPQMGYNQFEKRSIKGVWPPPGMREIAPRISVSRVDQQWLAHIVGHERRWAEVLHSVARVKPLTGTSGKSSAVKIISKTLNGPQQILQHQMN